jgi:hypothetical protein
VKQSPTPPLLARALRELENARRAGGRVSAEAVLIDIELKLVAAAFGKTTRAGSKSAARR